LVSCQHNGNERSHIDKNREWNKEGIREPEVMHYKEKIVASAARAFHFPWHPQDIEQHKSANAEFNTNPFL